MNAPSRISGDSPWHEELKPVVSQPSAGLPGFAIALVALVAALLLFFVLDGQRRRAETPLAASSDPEEALASPPPLEIPRATSPPVVPSFVIAVEPGPKRLRTGMPTAVQRPDTMPPVARQNSTQPSAPYVQSPGLVLPQTPRATEIPPAAPSVQKPVDDSSALVIDSGASRVWSDGPSMVGADGGKIKLNHNSVLPIGTSIPAVLETAIDSARPGLVRAIVARDTRATDGMRVLVPRGSRLFGEYDSASARGQKRVMVKWTKLILPDGANVELDSPATDWTGATGIPGRVSGFGLSRFLGSALQTALNVGENLITRTNTNTIVIAPATSAAYQATQTLATPANDRGPRITVRAGTLVNALVARDIDLSAASRAQ